ncbi:probable cytochrome P450 6a13 [Tenebrio molitor]|uniref:probable cytochrome P450 6a13 n=1 Tax=Tenebrio molitor TaxID=7067 RepID=UPI003624A061
MYVLVDLNYIKNILTKDFHCFTDRGFFHNEKDDPISNHIFLMSGTNKWKRMRAKLTPIFSSSRMKQMFQTLVECLPHLLSSLEADRVKDQPTNIKDTMSSFTMDVIGSCVFGLDLDIFNYENSPFRFFGKKMFTSVCAIPKDVSEFFMGVVKDTVKYRELNNYSRPDFIQLLIYLKNSGDALTVEEIAAQCFVFFLAGFDTSATTQTFTLYELAKNQDIQERLREEICTVLSHHEDRLTYEAIKDLTYMDQVVAESLRKYPPKAYLLRKCTTDYKIPDSDVTIEKDMGVVVPVMGIHHDPEYYPNPKKFDPQRFNQANKRSRPQYSYLPFGEGPRNCIGGI